MQQFNIGDTRLSVINLGNLFFSLKDLMSLPESEWRARYGGLFEVKRSYPSQSILVMTGNLIVLVDPGDYAKFAVEGPQYIDPNYNPPPGLVAQLAGIGVAPEKVTHVVITHAHYDHYAGITAVSKTEAVPIFPGARHLLGRGDWEWSELTKAIAEPSSNEAKTLGALDRLGLLEIVTGDRELASGLTVISAPGESPGHQVLRVKSGGQTAYCLGDLFHSSFEVENPELMASSCDPQANTRSRKAIIKSALDENALLIPSHMLPGRILNVRGGATYVPIQG